MFPIGQNLIITCVTHVILAKRFVFSIDKFAQYLCELAFIACANCIHSFPLYMACTYNKEMKHAMLYES